MSVTITTGCHSAGVLPFWEIETGFVYLGTIREVSKHRPPEGARVQLGRLTLRKEPLPHTESKHLAFFLGPPSSRQGTGHS